MTVLLGCNKKSGIFSSDISDNIFLSLTELPNKSNGNGTERRQWETMLKSPLYQTQSIEERIVQYLSCRADSFSHRDIRSTCFTRLVNTSARNSALAQEKKGRIPSTACSHDDTHMRFLIDETPCEENDP